MKKLKKVRYYVEYILVGFIFKIFGKMNIITASNMCGAIGRPIAKLICKINGKHKMAITNLGLCFPDKTSVQKEQIMNKFYEGMGRFIGEFITQKQMDEKYFRENVEVINGEILEEYFKKGFFGVTGHFGNWELIHKYLATRGQVLNLIYRKQNNTLVEESFINNRPVNQIDKRSNAMRAIMNWIKEKRIVGILIDQRDNGGDKFQFFGRPARTGVAIQRLSLKYDYKMIFVKCVRRKEDMSKFKMVCYPPLEIKKTGNPDEDIKRLTIKTMEMLEDWIKEDPEQWMWIYDRWK